MKKLLNHIIQLCISFFTQCLYVIFILTAGTGCALASGLIEYKVFTELFPKEGILIPLLIVGAFEVSKVFLVVLQKQESYLEYSPSNRRWFSFLRIALIGISLIATLFYSFYNLDNPEYESQLQEARDRITLNHNQQIKEIRDRYASHIERVNNQCDKEMEMVRQQYQKEIDGWKQEMKKEERYRDSQGSFQGKRYQTYLEHYERAKQQQLNAISQVQCNRDSLVQAEKNEILALATTKEQNLASITDTLRQSISSGNKFLSSTIVVLYGHDSGTDIYQQAYRRWVIILSFLMSLGMELIIYAAFTILAINHGSALSFGNKTQKLIEQFQQAEETILEFELAKKKAYEKRVVAEQEIIEDTLRHFFEDHENEESDEQDYV